MLDPPNPTVTYTFINCTDKLLEEDQIDGEGEEIECNSSHWSTKYRKRGRGENREKCKVKEVTRNKKEAQHRDKKKREEGREREKKGRSIKEWSIKE